MRQIEVGVFLPIGNNGYLLSTTSPQYMPTWQLQRDLAVTSEALGYDFLFSMSKWRGFGGATRFWDFTLESVSVMTALAAASQRIRLIATMSPPLLHPVVAAKMAATIDEISGGRFGINIVTGSSLAEYRPDGRAAARLRRLSLHLRGRVAGRRQATVDGAGRRLRWRFSSTCAIACSTPSPSRNRARFWSVPAFPKRGSALTAAEADCSFLTAKTVPETRALSDRMKQVARDHGRAIRTATPMLLVIGESDAAARSEHRHYVEGLDRGAIDRLYASYGGSARPSAPGAHRPARSARRRSAAR
jgi:pyrimidine oxygenase